jgi:hypothetical protein
LGLAPTEGVDMDVGRVRAAGASLIAAGLMGLAASPALAAPGVSVSAVSSLKAGATAGTLTGKVVNDTNRATRAQVTVRILRRGTQRRVVGRTGVKVGAHSSADYSVGVTVPSGLTRGNYYLAACTPSGTGAGKYGCATAHEDVLIDGGIPVRGTAATTALAKAAQAAPAPCSSGAHTLSAPGSKVYPETGNGGYMSLHTDVYNVYDAVANLFLPGNHVDLSQRSRQCLTDFSLDFERTNGTTAGPNMTVDSVLINGQPATFKYVQPTYPGDPNGQDDPDPLAHAASLTNPVGGAGANPLPPACTPPGSGAALQGAQCPANKLVITPSAPIPGGTDFKVTINYTGRPGTHIDGDGSTEGWFRNNTPVGDGSFVTTEPVGSMAWMPLNNHPTVKPTYDFYDTVTAGRTAIANGVLVGFTDNAPDANFPVPAAGVGGGSRTWHWRSPEPIASYLVENSMGAYDLTERLAPSGVLFYEAQSSSIATAQKATNKVIMDKQEDITNFQTQFNGPFPFSTNGVIVGIPNAGFEEEMQTKITFQRGRISEATFHHENMHQWWGDNVSEGAYNLTFFKEGYADLSEGLFAARTAAIAAGGEGTPAGDTAFDNSLINRFNSTYNNNNNTSWAVAPSNPTAANLFGSQTYTRSGRGYIALRQILGKGNFNKASQEIQATYGGGSITQPQQIAIYHKWMPNASAACSAKLDAFFKQWWDTAYTGSPAAGNKPQITGPGLAGQGFYDAAGNCADFGVAPVGGSVTPTLSLTLGTAAAFAPFTPGVAKPYTSSTTATVISTAGDAALSIADPSANAPGHLVNGAFSLPSALKATATSPGGVAAAGGAVSGSPLTLLTYAGPVSNDVAAIAFAQDIGQTDALRTGAYSKTLTFTVSTTTP